MTAVRALSAVLCVALTGCGRLVSGTAPDGLLCDRLTVASGPLEDALATAMPKDCVILTAGTYVGSFVLPVDVSLAGAQGAVVILKSNGSGNPVLTIRGGKRSTVRGVKIDSSAGMGIAIDPGPANLVGVVVAGNATHGALTSTCNSGTCDEVLLEDCELTTSTVGLLVSGGNLRMKGGRIAEMGGTGLSDGSGAVASRGARLTLDGVTIESNAQAGLLIDGAATRVTLANTNVRGNRERGVWVQNVGSDGAVSITGGEISANRLVGVGVRDSTGVTLRQVTVKDTALVAVPNGNLGTEMAGDGVGLFSGARDVTLDSLVAKGNGRAQILADTVGTGITVTAPDLSGGLYRVVVQHSGGNAVDVPAMFIDDPGRELAVKAGAVPISP